MNTNQVEDVASQREKFNHLYAQLVVIRASAIDGIFKSYAAVLLVAGWIATSDSARRALASDTVLRWTAASSIAVYALLFALQAHRVVRNSQRIQALLATTNYLPFAYYESIVLTHRTVAKYVLMNTLLSVGLVVELLRTAG